MLFLNYFSEMHLGWWVLWAILLVGMFISASGITTPFKRRKSFYKFIYIKNKLKDKPEVPEPNSEPNIPPPPTDPIKPELPEIKPGQTRPDPKSVPETEPFIPY